MLLIVTTFGVTSETSDARSASGLPLLASLRQLTPGVSAELRKNGKMPVFGLRISAVAVAPVWPFEIPITVARPKLTVRRGVVTVIRVAPLVISTCLSAVPVAVQSASAAMPLAGSLPPGVLSRRDSNAAVQALTGALGR